VRNDVPLKDTAFSIDSLSANVIYAAPLGWPVMASVKMLTLSTVPHFMKCTDNASFVAAKCTFLTKIVLESASSSELAWGPTVDQYFD